MSTGWTSDQVKMTVMIDNLKLSPHSPLTGKICVVVTEQISCTSLAITYVGSEMSVVDSGDPDTPHEGRADFLNFTFPVTEFPNGFLRVGNYEYQFSCLLPNGLPATFSSHFGESYCQVKYSANATLSSSEDQNSMTTKSEFFLSSGNPPVQGGQIFMNPICHSVRNFCGLLDGGSIVIAAALSTNVLTVDETHTIQFAVQNSSTLTIASVEVLITESVCWQAGDNSSGKDQTIFRMTQKEVSSFLTPKTTRKSDNGKVSDSQDYLRQLKGSLEQAASSGIGSINIFLADGTRNSYRGEIVEVEHELRVKITTTSGIELPELSLDIFVVGSTYELSRPPGEHVYTKRKSMAIETSMQPMLSGVSEMSLHDYVDPVVINRLKSFNCETDISRTISKSRSLKNGAIIRKQSSIGGFEMLERSLLGSFDQVETFNEWTEANDPNELSAVNYNSLFSAIRNVVDQIEIADKLGRLLTSISCEQLAEAARGCVKPCEQTIIKKLVSPSGSVRDKENRKLVEDQIGTFQMITLEQYF
jgi:hypothetical protein